MPDEKCIFDPQRDCMGLIKARELEEDLKALEKRNGDDHKEFRETIREIREMAITQSANFQTIIRDSGEIKNDLKGLIERLAEIKPRVEHADKLEGELKAVESRVDEIEKKPGKTWEDIKAKAIGWTVALILAILAAALGLSRFL